MRIPSPIPDAHRHRLAVPGASEGGSKASDLWVEEENDLIKNFGALFKLLGLPKSFSTSDISSPSLNNPPNNQTGPIVLRRSSSELDLSQVRGSDVIFKTHFGPASRSCSTWVAVGDVSSTSQLPSPQGRPSPAANGGPFTPADLVRTVNKKMRQLYIRKRLLVAYKALERMTQSDFDLEKLPVVVSMNMLSSSCPGGTGDLTATGAATGNVTTSTTTNVPNPASGTSSKGDLESFKLPGKRSPNPKDMPLTLKDVERERGRPLSKFERNMMIFTWLHTLDEASYEALE